MDIIDRILTALLVPAPARAVYIDLVEHGASKARIIASRLSMTRPSVYDQLKFLMKRGLVVEREIDGKTEFALHDIRDLERLMIEEKKSLDILQSELSAVSATLSKKDHGVEPKIKFITSREGIIQSMHDMLWDERQVLKVVWPYDEMLRVLGTEALSLFNKKRIKNGIRMQTIWSRTTKAGDGHIWKDEDWGVERRIAPQRFAPRMGYTVYDNKVLLVSGAAETFGFTVQSADFADLMRLQFDVIWDMSQEEKTVRRSRKSSRK
jgi:predicted transcriptional regulator